MTINDVVNWAIEQCGEDGKPKKRIARFILTANWLCTEVWYRLARRGVCAIKGCNTKSYSSSYLPDDCYEWECTRCRSEGINAQVMSPYNPFNGEHKLRDFILSIRGR